MIKSYYIILIVLFLAQGAIAQDSQIWGKFVEAKKSDKELPLPDFSYAGYKYSEVAIPSVDYKIFNVLDYGAIADDDLSDKAAIQKAIDAAEKNGEGVIYFPKGRYMINTNDDDNSIITITKSNIVLRGEGAGDKGTVLFFDRDLPAADPKKMWTCPYAIQTKVDKKEDEITKVVSPALRETFSIEVKDASRLKPNQWVVLYMLSNDKELIEKELAPHKAEEAWKTILNEGVKINEIHQIKEIKKNRVIFYEPIHYTIDTKYEWSVKQYNSIENVGFEDVKFEGNWTNPFVHHKNAQHDGGWSILKLQRTVNSWVKNCCFTNVSRAIDFSNASACTALNNKIEGNYGHNAITITSGSTGILNAKTVDTAGMWHACGVGNASITANVVWRCTHADHTSFECHASQPRCTLFDNMKGGFAAGRGGGAQVNQPNHHQFLVLWNYKETDKGEENFEWWSTKSKYWRVVPPIIVGFQGTTTFKKGDVAYEESHGKKVQPESLFEEQLKLRLGFLPQWIKDELK